MKRKTSKRPTTKKKRRNKYSSVRTGQFKSRLENTIWKQLPHKDLRYKFQYEKDRITYVVRKTYIPDIVVTKFGGEKFYIEVKGWFRQEDRAKMIAAKAFNPNLDIRIVFASDSPLRKGSKTRYSDWARKHGFEYAIGEVPKEWFESETRDRLSGSISP